MEWKISQEPVEYAQALDFMDRRVAAIHADQEEEMVWLLEHPPLYTGGTSAKDGDLLDPRFPVFKTGRGGEYTYHGPGQRIAYVMLDLKKRQQRPDIKQYVCDLEQWIINTLQEFDIKGERRKGRVGIWVPSSPSGLCRTSASEPEKKIAAIGVRVRRWITLHGVSINVDPDLSHYGGIVPCGISEHGVTSMKDLGMDVTIQQLDTALKETWNDVFGSEHVASLKRAV